MKSIFEFNLRVVADKHRALKTYSLNRPGLLCSGRGLLGESQAVPNNWS